MRFCLAGSACRVPPSPEWLCAGAANKALDKPPQVILYRTHTVWGGYGRRGTRGDRSDGGCGTASAGVVGTQRLLFLTLPYHSRLIAEFSLCIGLRQSHPTHQDLSSS